MPGPKAKINALCTVGQYMAESEKPVKMWRISGHNIAFHYDSQSFAGFMPNDGHSRQDKRMTTTRQFMGGILGDQAAA